MTTIAQMALKNVKQQKKRETQSKQTSVVIVGARQRVNSKTLGEITRRKTDDKTVVDLYSGDTKVGYANAVYKTATQRKWTVNLNGQTVYDQHTINKGIRLLLETIEQEETAVTKPKAKTKTKRSAQKVLEAQ